MSNMAMYNAILKWSLTQSDGFTSSEGDNAIQPMSEERKGFLRKAMDTYIVNETQRINDIVEILNFVPGSEAAGGATPAKGDTVGATDASSNYSDVIKAAVDIKVSGGTPDIRAMLSVVPASAVTDIKVEALTELEERIEQVDNATFFACGANGTGELELLLDLLVQHPSTRVRVGAGSVLATVLQNNEKSQARASEISGFMSKLVFVTRNPQNDHTVQTKAFGVITNYIRGSNPAARLAQFLSPAVQGPELLEAILASTQARGVWERYTPQYTSTPRDGWWRRVPQGEAVDRGSEIAFDFANGVNWVKYKGEGDPSAEGSEINERLVKKALFFLQFLLRSAAQGRAGNVAHLVQRLNLTGPAGAALVEFVGNTSLDAVDTSEGAAKALLLFLQLVDDQPTSSSQAAVAGVFAAATTSSAPPSTSTDIVSIPKDDGDTNSSSALTSTAIVSIPEDNSDANTSPVSAAQPAEALPSSASSGLRLASYQTSFSEKFSAKLAAACDAQQKALIDSTGGDKEQLEYVQEPLQLFKSLAVALA